MKDQTVIITGGSDGLGKDAALELARAGARVLITGRREAPLNEVASQHENITALVADAADPKNAKVIIDKAISLWGKLDVLINNAGAGATAMLEDVSAEQISNVFAVNVVGTSLLAAEAIPYLRKSKGSIINISSVIGLKPAPGISHYGASKAALDYLTRTWALELAPDIRVNAISPGPTKSGALTGMMGLSKEQAEAVEKQEAEQTPLKRRGVPGDITPWIMMLAGPDAAWVTGQVIGIDGGFGL